MRSVICCAVLFFVVANHARAEDVTKQPVYKTPQAVFEAAKKAMLANDMKSFLKLVTSRSLDVSSIAMLEEAVPAQPAFGKLPPKIIKRQRKAEAILEKHGITKQLQKDLLAARDKSLKAMKELALKILKEKVKDRIQLMNDFFQFMIEEHPKQVPTDMQLVDVKITGDTASGTSIMTFNRGKARITGRDQMHFQKVGKSWKIVILDEKEDPAPEPKIKKPAVEKK